MDRQQIAKRNFWIMLVEGAMFHVGYSFLQTDTVAARFLDFTSHSPTMVGLAGTIASSMFLVGQVVCGMFIHRVPKQSRFMTRWGLISRLIIPALAAAMFAGIKGIAAAWMFLIMFALFLFTDGFVGLNWTQIAARTLPVRKRGEVIALQQSLCGVLGILTGYILQRILNSSLDEYRKFAVIFACSGLALLISVIFLASIEDLPHASRPEQPMKNPVQYIRELIPLFTTNRGVRQVALSRCLFAISIMALPLNYKFGQMNGLSDYELTLLVYMPIAGRIISGVFWSQLTRLKGYPSAMLASHIISLLSAACSLLALVMAVMGYSVFIPVSAAMILLSVNSQASNSFTQHVIAIVSEEDRSGYIVLLALITAPMALASTLGGLIAGFAGFLPVYCIASVIAVAGIIQTWAFFFSKDSPLPKEQRSGYQ